MESNYTSGAAGSGADNQHAVGNPGGSIQDAMQASRNKLSTAYSAVQERSNQMLHGAEGYIQEKPFQAVIYAASVGAVIGLVAGLMLGGAHTESSWHRRWW